MADDNRVLVLDIGKTNVKCHVLDNDGNTVWMDSMPNSNAGVSPYPHFDVEAIWAWFLDTIRRVPLRNEIGAINVSTHGAACVLLNSEGDLALPVLDYEHTDVEDLSVAYDSIRPEFARTFSPRLPAGLNLGLQLFWLREKFPGNFSETRRILMYPQYWVWRISNVLISEVTSLGSHTDLWEPLAHQYSSLVDDLDIRDRLPPMVSAFESVGKISPDFAHETGLPSGCRVFAGVHDSNASLASYLYADNDRPFTVVSAGTWVVCMNLAASLDVLHEESDMLANVNVLGNPVPCARFMGGREFEEICARTDGRLEDNCDVTDIRQIIDDRVFATPSFANYGGPFSASVGQITGNPKSGKSLALLYLSLMIDYELDLLKSSGDVILGSTAAKNPLICEMLAQLRPTQEILVAHRQAATVTGAWALTRWDETVPKELSQYELIPPSAIRGLLSYRDEWRSKLGL